MKIGNQQLLQLSGVGLDDMIEEPKALTIKKNWKKEWGGRLLILAHFKKKNKPDKLVTVVSLIVAWIYVASTAFRLLACEYVMAPVIIMGAEEL